jgi:DNA-binding transcriptional LysR family regulator
VRRDGSASVTCAQGPVLAQSDDLNVLMRLAEGGMGVVLAPSYCVQEAVNAGRLINLVPDWSLDIRMGNVVKLLTLPWPQLGPVARAFTQFLQAALPLGSTD